MTSSPQSLQCPTQAIGQILAHPQANDYVRFLCAVAVLRDSSEGHADDAFLVEEFGEQVDVQGRNPILKYHEPFPVMLNLTDRSDHVSHSIQKVAA